MSEQNILVDLEQLTPAQRDRAVMARDFLQRLCTEEGLRLSSWEDFRAWKDYVNERIDESQLNEEAKAEMNDFAKTFGKYLIIDDNEPSLEKVEPIKKERARLASRIYRKICEDAGVEVCFFRNFSAWSDYVRGVISEGEFYEQARSELERMASKQK